ncbi:MAG: site-specific DNA-methyltransferase [Chloroflexi bacterium]|nr:site-specific DNA-methyltransferase [Chloroflexota bacterium]
MTPYYERDGIVIYCGDCLEVMPGLEGPVDAIITDLPYGTTACSWDTIIPFEPLWVEYKRLIKERGAVVLTGSQPFTSQLIMSNLEWFKYEWIWEKKIKTRFLDVKSRPLLEHENVLLFCDGSPTYNPQMTKGKSHKRNRNQGKQTDNYGKFASLGEYISDEYYPTSILSIDHDKSRYTTLKHRPNRTKQHPTQKPVALFAYLIRTYTNPGDLVLDNTMGSGTTLLAAQNEGRQALGIEISEEYCQIAVDRLRQPTFFSLPTMKKQPEYQQEALF